VNSSTAGVALNEVHKITSVGSMLYLFVYLTARSFTFDFGLRLNGLNSVLGELLPNLLRCGGRCSMT
jgi:hypothetical protein